MLLALDGNKGLHFNQDSDHLLHPAKVTSLSIPICHKLLAPTMWCSIPLRTFVLLRLESEEENVAKHSSSTVGRAVIIDETIESLGVYRKPYRELLHRNFFVLPPGADISGQFTYFASLVCSHCHVPGWLYVYHAAGVLYCHSPTTPWIEARLHLLLGHSTWVCPWPIHYSNIWLISVVLNLKIFLWGRRWKLCIWHSRCFV